MYSFITRKQLRMIKEVARQDGQQVLPEVVTNVPRDQWCVKGTCVTWQYWSTDMHRVKLKEIAKKNFSTVKRTESPWLWRYITDGFRSLPRDRTPTRGASWVNKKSKKKKRQYAFVLFEIVLNLHGVVWRGHRFLDSFFRESSFPARGFERIGQDYTKSTK